MYIVNQYSNKKPEHGTFHAYKHFDTYLISVEFQTLTAARLYFNIKMSSSPVHPCWIENENGKIVQKKYHGAKK